MDADQYVAQRVGRRGQAARFLQGGHAGPGRAVARDDVAQLLVELPYAGDLQSQTFITSLNDCESEQLSSAHEHMFKRLLV